MNIIIGDSWGVGEFDKDARQSGPGVGQYMMLHSDVINLSIGGNSNSGALFSLERLLQRLTPKDGDRIFWIVTCPTRCAGMDHFLHSKDTILDASRKLLDAAFSWSNELVRFLEIKIDVIGGLCDLQDVDISQYQNLNMLVPSWGRLIDPRYQAPIIDPVWWQEFGEILKSNNDPRLEEWLAISDRLIDRNRYWKKHFESDGGHPDRRGHKILRDHIFPEWSHKY